MGLRLQACGLLCVVHAFCALDISIADWSRLMKNLTGALVLLSVRFPKSADCGPRLIVDSWWRFLLTTPGARC